MLRMALRISGDASVVFGISRSPLGPPGDNDLSSAYALPRDIQPEVINMEYSQSFVMPNHSNSFIMPGYEEQNIINYPFQVSPHIS